LSPEAISDDGSTLVGNDGSTEPDRRAMKWTRGAGVSVLPPSTSGEIMAFARGVSADGSLIVGSTVGAADQRALIWDEIHGTRNLQALLIDEFGLSQQLAGWRLLTARGISADGRTIAGIGFNAAGDYEAFVTYLGAAVPEPNIAILAVVASLMLSVTSGTRK
jgi:uncharacterized membrane protein